MFRVTSFWNIENGLIAEGREYWITVGGEAQPEWRKHLATVTTQ